MTSSENSLTYPQAQQYNSFDAPIAIFAAIVIGFVGNAVFMGMPLLVGAMADSLGFDQQQLGWLASADLGGIFIGSVLTSLVITRVNRRYFAAFAIISIILANYSSSLTTDFSALMTVRILAGIASGICYSTGVACIAATHHTGRNFSYLLFALVITNALEFYTFPDISSRWGVNGIFLCFAAVSALGLLVLHWIPPHSIEKTDEVLLVDNKRPVSLQIPTFLPWCCLTAVFCFNLLTGAFWSFIERAGVDAGFSHEFIGNALTWGTLFSLSGCALAAWLSSRFGQSKPLLLALSCMTLLMLTIAWELNTTTYIGGIFIFNMFWIFTDVFQLGTISNIDHSGRFAALVPSSQGISQTIAPVAAGFLLAKDLGFASVLIMGACGSSAAFVIYFFVYRELKRLAPSVADAD